MRMHLPVFTALLMSAPAVAASRDFERRVTVDPRGRIEISNVAGEIEVSGWDQPEIEIRAMLDEDVEGVDVTTDRDRTVIKVTLRGHDRHGEASLRVRVPKDCELEVTAVSAPVQVRGVFGEQRLRTVSGDISTDLGQADIETRTVTGNTLLSGSGKPNSVRATSISGDIHYDKGAGELEATTVSGSVVATLQLARSIRVRSTSGDVTVRGSLTSDASVEAETISGEITVRMKPEAGFSYEASTFSGDIDTCFDQEPERTSRYGPGKRLSGQRGESSKAEVRLKSLSGEVSLCDH